MVSRQKCKTNKMIHWGFQLHSILNMTSMSYLLYLFISIKHILRRTERQYVRSRECSRNTLPKYFKEPVLCFHRHYCDLCPVQRPINSIVNGQDFSSFYSILKKHRSVRQQQFQYKLKPCSLKWTKFCNFRIF